jgi:hypothetical protein
MNTKGCLLGFRDYYILMYKLVPYGSTYLRKLGEDQRDLRGLR